MFKRRTALLILFFVLGLFVAYWRSTYWAAYTDNAYVTSDLVAVAPEVNGYIDAIHVIDNQLVQAGDPLVDIDPTPYRLTMNRDRAAWEEAKAQRKALEEQVKRSRAVRQERRADLKLAAVTEERYARLFQERVVAKQDYDQVSDKLSVARGELQAAEDTLGAAVQALAVQDRVVELTRAKLELSEYYLARTRLTAPLAGYVNALEIQPGDWAKEGEAVLGIVDADAWRVEANYREYLVRHMKPGQRVIVYLDGYPWRLFNGTVQGVRRGVSRSPANQKLMPYVEPTIDWVRLARRFPVRIHLDDLPEDVRLLMGADARTLVIYGRANATVEATNATETNATADATASNATTANATTPSGT